MQTQMRIDLTFLELSQAVLEYVKSKGIKVPDDAKVTYQCRGPDVKNVGGITSIDTSIATQVVDIVPGVIGTSTVTSPLLQPIPPPIQPQLPPLPLPLPLSA